MSLITIERKCAISFCHNPVSSREADSEAAFLCDFHYMAYLKLEGMQLEGTPEFMAIINKILRSPQAQQLREWKREFWDKMHVH